VCLAIPGQVIDFVDEPRRLARVEVAGVRRTVNVGLLDGLATGGEGVGPGDWVLIHVGFEYETELQELKASAIE
jgi:hydrogenase expression/formation protein HypC